VTHRWVENDEQLTDVIHRLAGEPAVALDTEFHRERTYHPQVALLQLGWRSDDGASTEVALVDTLAVDVAPLATVLTSSTTIVMHAAAQDLEVLQRACGTLPAHLVDTQIAAGFLGFSTPSLANLLDGVLGIRLPKGDRLADWLHRPLSVDQREYAASDVAHLLDLHDELVVRLIDAGRLDWATDECDEQLARAAVPKDPNEAWWRVKEARSLRWPAVGVAQTLAAWRERRAARIDQPVRFVLPDLALVGIAQRPPTDAQAVRRVRGLDERHTRNGAAEEILGAIAAAKDMPRSELRTPPPGDVDRDLRAAVTLASAWVSQLGRQLKIDPSLLATRSDLEAFLRGDASARLGQGWREQVAGAAVRGLVAGDAALAFDGKGGLVIEERSGKPVL
jgi:ribonuclease D